MYLTIDIELQAAAEKALKGNIEYVHKQAALTEGDLDGEDADAGALTVIDVKTGAVLALASYQALILQLTAGILKSYRRTKRHRFSIVRFREHIRPVRHLNRLWLLLPCQRE